MKKIGLFIGLIIILIACDLASLENSLNEQAENIYKDEVEKQLSSGKRNDTIIQSFVFGMTRDEVSIHYEKLKSENKVQFENRSYFYEM